jgi:hypothetical protein
MALLPTTPAPNGVNIETVSNNLTTFAFSGRRQTKSQGAQYFKFDVRYPNMRQSDSAPLMAFITGVKGQFTSFTMRLPQISQNHASYTGANPAVDNASDYAVGATSVAYDGASNSTAILKAGDFITFSGHTKAYMVTADATSDGTGAGSISFTPPLITAVTDDETIKVKDVDFTVILDDDTSNFNHGLGEITTMSFTVREAL